MARSVDPKLRELGFESHVLLSNLEQAITSHCSSSLSCMNEYLAIDSGGYLCMNNLRALIAAWLDSSRQAKMVFD